MPAPLLFICHVSEDRDAAMQIVEELERRGLRCWIAPRNVRPGRPFDDEIANAIDESDALLLIFSERCNDSEYIRREVTVAGEARKIIIPFRIENAEPKYGLRVRLSDLHWLDAYASQKKAIDELVNIFPMAKGDAAAEAAPQPPPVMAAAPQASPPNRKEEPAPPGRPPPFPPEPPPPLRRPWPPTPLTIGIVAAGLLVVAIGIGAFVVITKTKNPTQIVTQTSPAPTPPPPAPPPFSSAACKPQTASLYDDFHKPDPQGWNFTSGNFLHYADGQLVVMPLPGKALTPEYLSLRYENATICAHIKSPPEVKTMRQASAGVAFWATNASNFYTAVITPDGNYWISRLLAGTWINLIPSTKHASIKTDLNAVNEVSVALRDNFGALFINNVKVQEFRGQPPMGGGAIGLHAESEHDASDEWRFLDIAVMDNGKAKPLVLPPAPSGPTIGDCRPVNPTDFQDTFANPDPHWGQAAHYVDGHVSLKPAEHAYQMALYRPLVFKNATVCLTVKSPAEVADLEGYTTGGVAFWASDYRNFYVADIFPNGTFQIFRKVNNEWITVVRRSTSDAIKKGLDAVNELQVVLNGTSGALYVNGTKINDFRGQPPQEGGAVGFAAESEINHPDEWRFVNVTVVQNR